MTQRLLPLMLAAVVGCGRGEPQLFSVVRTSADGADACLALQEPSLAAVPREELMRLRPPSDHYAWIVGETVAGPTGLSGTLASLTGRSALVSLTSNAGAGPSTRAVATIEDGRVTHTFFGTPLTPAFSPEPGAQLSVTFDARVVDEPSLGAARAVLSVVPGETVAYASLLASLAPEPSPSRRGKGFAQTWVLRDPASCDSGACRAMLVGQRLVLLSETTTRTPSELAPKLCLKGTRLFETDGAEFDGTYAVLRLAHARLPEEALGEALADTLTRLARCDREFTPELAGRGVEQVSTATALRAGDRSALATLLHDARVATKATTAEALLDAERRLAASSARVCRETPEDGIVCARARALSACAATRARSASSVKEAWSALAGSLDTVEQAAACDERATALVALHRDATRLVAAAKAAQLGDGCTVSAAGLSCEAFPKASKRSKAAIAEAQDLLYRQCVCAPMLADREPLEAGRLVRQALRCEDPPEALTLVPEADTPITEKEAQAWKKRRDELVPTLTAVQCPACVRLHRRLDDELARAVALGRSQAQVTELLRRVLAPVTELHDRAFVLMSGEAGVRCAQRPDEWSVIARALDYEVAPADLFRPGGDVDPSRLEKRLAEARLLEEALEGLSCARDDVATGSR